jgi:hypothetical protein
MEARLHCLSQRRTDGRSAAHPARKQPSAGPQPTGTAFFSFFFFAEYDFFSNVNVFKI